MPTKPAQVDLVTFNSCSYYNPTRPGLPGLQPIVDKLKVACSLSLSLSFCILYPNCIPARKVTGPALGAAWAQVSFGQVLGGPAPQRWAMCGLVQLPWPATAVGWLQTAVISLQLMPSAATTVSSIVPQYRTDYRMASMKRPAQVAAGPGERRHYGPENSCVTRSVFALFGTTPHCALSLGETMTATQR